MSPDAALSAWYRALWQLNRGAIQSEISGSDRALWAVDRAAARFWLTPRTWKGPGQRLPSGAL